MRQQYASLAASDVQTFKSLLKDEAAVITDSDALKTYNTDWLKHYTGTSRIALRPKTTDQVAAVLQHCNARGVAVVPQAGNTSEQAFFPST